jgi:thioredoxin-like negative regulator of GroEL
VRWARNGLGRVLNAGLPVVLVFYDRDLTAELRQEMDNLSRQYAGKVLIVTLARSDAPQAASRFGVRSFPSLVTVRDSKTVTNLEGM